jgi:drug/metabolite transporter (DMT)-like permease
VTTAGTNTDASARTSLAGGYLLVILAGVLWSTVGLGIRLIEDALVWQILLYRSVGLSVLLYVVIRLRTGRDPLRLAVAGGWPALIGGAALVAAYAGGIYAIQTTSVADALLLFASAPFMAAILGWLILREPVRPRTWVAIAVACGGIAVMVGDSSGTSSPVGNAAALLSALGFAVFTITLRWGRAGDMLPAVFISGLLAIGVMTVICLALGLPLILSPRDGGIAAGMGVFQVGAGLIVYTIGSRHVPAAELTLLSLAEVVLGPLWVWLFLSETVSERTAIGGAILLTAIAANALLGIRRKPPVTLV